MMLNFLITLERKLVKGIYNMQEQGKVFLIGAGPGDPKLLTIKAYEILQKCPVIAYDALIAEEMISFLKDNFFAELIPVGYRGHQGNKIEHKMHPQVIQEAKKGKNVARLKSGDPFIFGRGMQECMDLINNGIDFEVIPGITAALGAAAYCHFPLTALGISSVVSLISGHHLDKDFSEATEKTLRSLAQMQGTLALYMASKKISPVFKRLVDCGFSTDAKAALIISATGSNQKIINGTIGSFCRSDEHENEHEYENENGPKLLIIGEVLGLQSVLSPNGQQKVAQKVWQPA